MNMNHELIKLQFKLDHLPLLNRVAVLSGVLFVMVLLWLLIAYFPQSGQATEVQQQIRKLKHQNSVLLGRNQKMLMHVKTQDQATLIDQYKQLRVEEQALEQEIKRYHYRYIDDKALAELLHAILNDIGNLRVENFSTILHEDRVVSTPLKADTKPKKAVKTPVVSGLTHSLLFPEMRRYSLSLKGDYSSIMKFLKRVEALKWQLFWDKLSYRVEKYPEAMATLEFYTLKAGAVAAAPEGGDT